jgi:hypothetical protein
MIAVAPVAELVVVEGDARVLVRMLVPRGLAVLVI